jgi:type II secretory pathway predicted ATPase ExeA
VDERERFAAMVHHGLEDAGCQQTLLSDTGIELLRQASQGNPRLTGTLLAQAMRLAVPKGLNHLPDELIEMAIAELHS